MKLVGRKENDIEYRKRIPENKFQSCLCILHTDVCVCMCVVSA